MKTLIVGVVAFALGGGTGYLVSTKVNVKKYQAQADKEIESVKESLKAYYEEKIAALQNAKEVTEKAKKEAKKEPEKYDDKPKKKNKLMDRDSIDYEQLKEDKKNYVQYVKPYSNDTAVKEGKPEEVATRICAPTLITPEEFSEGDYATQTLHWYKDGVLCDDDFNPIADINGTIGIDALNSFGVFQEDAVYVRNDNHKIDYEVLLEDDEYNRVAPRESIGVFPGDDD